MIGLSESTKCAHIVKVNYYYYFLYNSDFFLQVSSCLYHRLYYLLVVVYTHSVLGMLRMYEHTTVISKMCADVTYYCTVLFSGF